MIFLYGPPASGKTAIGQIIAEKLNLPFIDLDQIIEEFAGANIPEIFDREGEDGFRAWEKKALKNVITDFKGVMALGGGALLDKENRMLVEEHGNVICLNAKVDTLMKRLSSSETERPLVNQDLAKLLPQLLEKRQEHYNSFSNQLDCSIENQEDLAWKALIQLGEFLVGGMGRHYEVKVVPGGLSSLGRLLGERNLSAPIMVVSDENVASLYARQVISNLQQYTRPVSLITFPAGEKNKTLHTLEGIWRQFAVNGVERGGTILALGGGVVSDLAGFAAGAYLRGIPWVVLPTSLCAMVDAGVGGKTGVDLPHGKNLVGLFYAPRLVLIDPEALQTLPENELQAGMAEVVKAGVIGDPDLFDICRQGWTSIQSDWSDLISRAVAVKIKVIQSDPYEEGMRAALNFGHTVGHALEKVSNFSLTHGMAVSIGMVVETHLAEDLGLAQKGLTNELRGVLENLGLPTILPTHFEPEAIYHAMYFDKKKRKGRLQFAFPVQVGVVQVGFEVSDREMIIQAIKELRG